jgi:two-component system sensor histidine kinase KdpD
VTLSTTVERALASRPRASTAGLVVASLVGATIAVALVERFLAIPYAAPVYLLAVLVVGLFGGTLAAVVTAVASFLLYDFLFVQPLYTLTIADANEWLNLLLLLVIAVVIGRLAALEAARAAEATERAREAVALFRISRSLATSDDLASGARAVVDQLTGVTGMDRVWLGLGASRAEERIVADSGGESALPVPTLLVVLQRKPGDEPATWARTHVGTGAARKAKGAVVYRVRIEVPGEVLGSLWALRSMTDVEPDRAETRILSAAADQLGQAVKRDRLARNALDAEVARRSEALKTALLDSVSHDLRTPLATIRAAAGSMLDPGVEWTTAERTDALRTLDAEAERMNRLVRDLLDLSRIEAGALHPEIEPHDLDELAGRVVAGVAVRLSSGRSIELDVPTDLPPLLVDDTYVDEVLTNLVENAVRHGGERVRVSARPVAGGAMVEIVVEDDGPGVAPAELPHLFEKFYRAGPSKSGSSHGMGVGLTVAEGLTRAMHGSIVADRSELGGLAIRVCLPSIDLPAEDGESPETGSIAVPAEPVQEPVDTAR